MTVSFLPTDSGAAALGRRSLAVTFRVSVAGGAAGPRVHQGGINRGQSGTGQCGTGRTVRRVTRDQEDFIPLFIFSI